MHYQHGRRQAAVFFFRRIAFFPGPESDGCWRTLHFSQNGIGIESDFETRIVMNSGAPNPADSTRILASIQDVLECEAAGIAALAKRLDPTFSAAVHQILACSGKLIVSGMGKMGAIAQKAVATFCSTGTPAIFLHPSEALHGDLGVAAPGDLWIALSNSGETDELAAISPYMVRLQIPIIVLTGRTQSSLARQAQLVLDISVEREADTLTSAPTVSTTVALAACDALALAASHCRGLTTEQFALYHPGGFLGKRLLLTVRELMHTGSRIPLIDPDSTLREAILVISRQALGCGFVVDASGTLIGILTDGDLRRSLTASSNPLEELVARHMTPNPRAVAPEFSAARAIRLMEEHSITVLPVIDSARVPIGVVHLHDLVKAGLG